MAILSMYELGNLATFNQNDGLILLMVTFV